VRCTLDRDLQSFAGETLRRHVLEVRDRRVDDGAVIVIENSTGDVWVYVGGAGDLSNAQYFDAVRARRQPGSTLKPFLYALAVDEHLLTAASLLEDTPLEVSEQRGLYRPLDYDRHFHGRVSMRTALASSLNVPAVRTADMIGLEAFAHNLRQLGFRGLNEESDYYGAALALGSADVSLWELANGYRTLANGGNYSEPRLTRGASDDNSRAAVYSSQAAFVISDVLADRASRSATFGLENSLATRYWSAVKTGTSKDMRDNWCVGYTRRFTVAVWVGNSSGAPMRDVSGVTGAAPVWLEVMNHLNDRFGSEQIVQPAGVIASVVKYPESIEPQRLEWFIAGTEPNDQIKQLDHHVARITSPATGTTIALDPDLPPRTQRIAFEARETPINSRWMLDGRNLAPAASIALWSPTTGAHTVALIDASGRVLDSLPFSVRGSNATPVAEDDRSPE
jgi:penicillin-binding protein 1C